MCGIFGLCNHDGIDKEWNPNPIFSVIQHRGPDDRGTYYDDYALLLHCRLSIIDLSTYGHQPMSNEDDSLWIVYNGEIYNYKELNVHLNKQGHNIKSNCDTETILHLYEEYGEECVNHLRGIFAFAIWDKKKHVLYAVRDRMGVKPLYYSKIGNSLIFGSELKALWASEIIRNELDMEAVWHYLSFGAIPSPMTIWKNVWVLLPGHQLIFSNGELKIDKYWDARTIMAKSLTQIPTREDAKQQVRQLLEEAIRIRLMSDVPLGAFLSGGIDSSIIVGLMSQYLDRPVRTFSVGYDVGGDRFDERQYASHVAKYFQTDHQEILVKGSDVLSSLDKIIWHMDQPSHDALNSYIVSQAAATGVTVALSGLGGDELFGGYNTFKFISLLQRFHLLQKVTPMIFKKITASIDKTLSPRLQAQWLWRIGVGAIGAYRSLTDQYAVIRFFYRDSEKSRLLTSDFYREVKDAYHVESSLEFLKQHNLVGNRIDIVNQISYLELRTYMADVLLRDVDVMSMTHSLEVRVPFLDHQLVEFVLGLPGALKLLAYNDIKGLLKESVKDLLPSQILNRKKAGFAFPMAIWLHEPLFRDVVEDCLSEKSVKSRGIFNWEQIVQIKKQFYEYGQFGNYGHIWLRLWIPTVLELWCRSYLDSMNALQKGIYNG